uniref:Uncharacterized protein n=1 Tax=Ciona savignyi TaxID=51511 RepID=H2Z2G5_CIOSA
MPEQYVRNKATFSPNDELVLSDGMLWDPRASSTQPIHKFDKFNSTMSGIFHPRGTEVIINTEVWDLRNYHLLHTVPYIDQCTLHFNRDSTVMYAAKSVSHLEMEEIDEVDADSPGTTTFLAIDAHNYRPISVTDNWPAQDSSLTLSDISSPGEGDVDSDDSSVLYEMFG